MPVAKLRVRCCQWCSKGFELGVDSNLHKYCSVDCRKKWHANKYLTSERTKKDPRKQREYLLKRKYGIDHSKFDDMLAEQDGKCAICLTEDPAGVNWHVDHCHSTGKVRGLLCCSCNQSLGMLKENVSIMESMIKYVKDRC